MFGGATTYGHTGKADDWWRSGEPGIVTTKHEVEAVLSAYGAMINANIRGCDYVVALHAGPSAYKLSHLRQLNRMRIFFEKMRKKI